MSWLIFTGQSFNVKKQDQGDEALRKRLRELANERRRFGYRCLDILLAREGLEVNHKKLFRLYREEGLAVRRRRSRKRALGTRRPILGPDRSQHTKTAHIAWRAGPGRLRQSQPCHPACLA